MIDTAVRRPSWACQWPMPALWVIFREVPVERFGGVRGAVLVAEHEVIGVPGVADFAALGVFPGLVSLGRGDGALREGERALGLGGLGIAGLARTPPDVDHSPGQVYVISGELAQFARAEAERDRQDEEGFGVVGLVNAELGAARAAGCLLDLSAYLRDRRVRAALRPGAPFSRRTGSYCARSQSGRSFHSRRYAMVQTPPLSAILRGETRRLSGGRGRYELAVWTVNRSRPTVE